jgi:urease accessory protein
VVPTNAVSSDEGWRASLRLGFRATPGRTILAERARSGPLAVQRAFYPEGNLCHVYLLHPPGGIAGGDSLEISVCVEDDAHALVTTPGAGKFYRSAGPRARQQQRLSVGRGSLEWLPQETILFPGAHAELSTTVDLHAEARFLGWEIICLGRPVIGEAFTRGQAAFSLRLVRGGMPLLCERLNLEDGQARLTAAGLRGHPVFATLYATPCDTKQTELARATIPPTLAGQLAVTLIDGVLVARYLGESAEHAKCAFIEIWKALRPGLLGRPPTPPRIWNT